ncbi:NADP-dependent oxidoreductase [Pedomonas sp. V897]|uniref:NADP-dependent oxidoreductase n=1 Tax=Pedomonas sp. V897 TaxID=3446482 RepID=UPI003EDE7D67
MPQSRDVNRRIVLAARPKGAPTPENFRLEEAPVPEPREGQVLLRTLYLSLDPYMRGRMDDGPSYAEPVPVGGVMVGGTVSRVEQSRHPGFAPGDLVLSYCGWQDYGVSDGRELIRLDPAMENPSHALGVLGMPGMTAYFGLLDIGRPQPGETVAVAAATGAVGSVVGQIAKLKGCRVVGIAGGPEKCRHAVEALGFDACIDHRSDDFRQRLAEACPNGIDVYFENVGGKVFEAVLPRLNPGGRVPLCGLIAQYNMTHLPPGPDRMPQLLTTILIRRLKIQGFIVTLDYGHRAAEFNADMTRWVREGRIRYREDVTEGLENAPTAFMGLLEGRNFGKVVVKVGD